MNSDSNEAERGQFIIRVIALITFIPVKTKPGKIPKHCLLGFFSRPLQISILNPQQKFTTFRPETTNEWENPFQRLNLQNEKRRRRKPSDLAKR